MKKRGEFKTARAKHLSRQRVYDALKKLRELPRGETIELRLHGRLFRVRAESEVVCGTLVYVHCGRICIGHGYKDEPRVMRDDTCGPIVTPTKVLAAVVDEFIDGRWERGWNR